MIPHVTQFDEADITALEAHRVKLNQQNEKLGIKVTILAFLVKAVVDTLKKYPEANSSLDGDNLVVKHYYHIGFAADTPNGLVVPVIRDADRKSVLEIAREAAELAKKAREGKLSPAEMQGGCFTISSLGRYWRHKIHADHQRPGSGDSGRVEIRDKAQMERQGLCAAPDVTAVPVLRSPRGGRCRRARVLSPI